jgi:Tfp pilus assembly protein PilF
LLISGGAGKAALDVLEGAPENQKTRREVIEQRTWALISLGNYAEARKSIDQGLAGSRSEEVLLQDAVWKIESKHNSEARQALHEALLKSPEDLRALELLVHSYAVENQTATAAKELRAYAAQHPKSAEIQQYLGTVLLQAGDRTTARQAFNAARAINPEFIPAALSLAQVDLLESNWAPARAELSAILAKKGDTPVAHQWMGMLEYSTGNPTAAVAEFRKVIEGQPENVTALNNLAFILAENANKADEALQYAQKAKELQPDNPEVDDTLGWVLYRKGVYASAVSYLERAVAKQSTAVRQFHLAMAYYMAGQQNRGRTVLESALRVNSKVPEAQMAQKLFGAPSRQ